MPKKYISLCKFVSSHIISICMLENIIPQSSVEAIEKIISGNERFVLLSHKNPDGDSFCSVLALAKLLEKYG